MLHFARNKVISICKKAENTLVAHGILEDDIYGLELDVAVSLPDLEITAVQGKWNRLENAECPRALPFLQEAVGFRIEPGLTQRIGKTIGRKACRHFANLLIECCQSLEQAAQITREEEPQRAVQAGAAPEDRRADAGIKQSLPQGMHIDLHVHTAEASPCSSAAVDLLIKEAQRIGLDGICLTDHNHVWKAARIEELRQKHGFLVFRGNEITTDQGDILVFGFNEEIQGIIPLADLRKQVLKTGAFMIAAHPFRGFLTFGIGHLGLTPEKAMERALFRFVDAVEVLNSRVTAKENAFAAKVAAGMGLPGTGGSDSHEVSEVGIYATSFSHDIKEEKDLLAALHGGNYSPVCFRENRESF